MKKLHLFFISTPGIGNLVPLIEFARLLTNHDRRFHATVLLISIPKRPIVTSYIQSRGASSSLDDNPITFVHLPAVDPPSSDQYESSLAYLCLLIDKHKPHVKHAIANALQIRSNSDSDSVRVAGFFVDMFCTSMIDVANELGIPSYLYFASPASFLGFLLYLPTLDAQLATEFVDSEHTQLIVPKDSFTELKIPSFVNALPPLVLPTTVLKRKEDGYAWFLYHARRYTETKGMVVNTFQELEPYAIDSLRVGGMPPVYPTGPVLDLAGPAEWHPDRVHQENIMKWLDDQPPSSVVFLLFWKHGFLWSTRERPKNTAHLSDEYSNLEEVLPEGFLDRTAKIGLVCGWVPQATILAHQAIGGFVSHCGWNSIMESLWYGVPIATWPIYAEQQLNAFQLVKELRLAVEIRLDYREGSNLVSAEELEKSIATADGR
ncbi:Glycosyltransferase [Melia azedarach]|uniref:Glycosyltransferase n=1 Tax=Melia azedarach TaxID=155640 RepID=A0ACC1WX53_MELAZ|nr:Glycosyltransferase [Melia azedarach]